jgi:hypothetical protein
VGPLSLTACTHAHPTGGRLGSTGAGSVTISSVIVAAISWSLVIAAVAAGM